MQNPEECPITEGSVIRLPLPDLTEQRRKDLIKVLKKYSDRAKVALRNIRKGSITKIKAAEKEKEISEDVMHTEIKNLDKIVAEFHHRYDYKLYLYLYLYLKKR